MVNEGVKHDDNKPRVDLIPFRVLLQIGEAFRHGAQKYGDRNWEKGLSPDRLLGAVLRHLFKYGAGEDLDPESGLPHLAHAGASLLMLAETVNRLNDAADAGRNIE